MIRVNPSCRPVVHAAMLGFGILGSMVLAGCGHGTLASPSGTNIESMHGLVHGGQSPIQGATVKLYHTDPNASAYGAPAIFIGSAITDVNGNFSIASSTYSGTGSPANTTNCPAGSQAYITAAGGYQSGQPTLVNNNMLMMAAFGDCSTVNANTGVIINELTSVAAAYALSSFMTTALDGSNSFYAASIGAPTGNNAPLGSATPTRPAGLAHAFLNAAKLANISLGVANATTTASTGGTTTLGSVPVAEINTLADIMQSCVNTASGANGGVVSIPVTNGGSGYGATLSFTGGSGSGAAGNAIVNASGQVVGYNLTSGGSNYSPSVTVTNGLGTGAVIIPTVSNGAVTGATIESGGTGYTPTITIAPPPSGTTATATTTVSNGTLSSANLVNVGSGYTPGSNPTVTVSSPISGTTAVVKATATSAGNLTLSVTSAGSGYGTLTVASPTSGTTATLNYLASAGIIYNVSVSAAGSGYGPTLVVNGAGSGAAGTTTVSGGAIIGLTLTASGSGYTVPAVTVAPPASGTAATATAITTGGAVSAITLTSSGSGYTSAPAVSISAPPAGTTATATATIPSDSASANVAASSSCGQLFALTPSLGGNNANNTLQAIINLARNPYPSPSAFYNSGLFSLVSSSPAFLPVLASQPGDWSVSVVYGTTTTSAVTGTALGVPYWLTLDANDTAYLSVNFPSPATQPALYGIGSYGTSVPAFGAATTSAAGRGIAADALGNIWFTNNSSSPAASYLYSYSASAGGAPTTYSTFYYGTYVAVDAANNIWVTHNIAGVPNFDEFAYTPGTGGATGTWAKNFTSSITAAPYGIGVDANQNIWVAGYSTSGASGNNTTAIVLANSGTASAPNYNPAGTLVTPLTTNFAGGAKAPYGVVLDASGNAWYDISGVNSTATAGVEEVVPNSTTALTSLTPGNFISGLSSGPNGTAFNTMTLNLAAIDGAGTLFIPDTNSNATSLRMYSTITGNSLAAIAGIKSCLLTNSSSTTCGTTTAGAVYSPHQMAVDSTGSVWGPNNNGGATELIGLGAPSYPLLSIGKPGLSPGLTTVAPLP